MFDGGLLVLIQVHLDQLGSVELDADTLADHLRREYQILQDGIVHGGERSGTRSLLLVGVAASTHRFGQNAALGNEHDVLAGELLLQLAHQTGLYLLEGLLFRHRHVDDDRLKCKPKHNTQISHQSSILFPCPVRARLPSCC